MLRFTIRDVLWLTLVVGLVLGWWVDRGRVDERLIQVARRCESLAAANRLLNAMVESDAERTQPSALPNP